MTPQTEWVSDEEWENATSLDKPEREAMSSAPWRIANLYSIKNKAGELIPFIPTREQRVIIYDICVRGYTNIVIPKARKLGMSTVLCVIGADMVAFRAGVQVALVDKRADDAREKLENIVRVAVSSIHPLYSSRLVSPVRGDNAGELALVRLNSKELPSRFTADVSFRGGTPQFLIVSEWGEVQTKDPKRSTEIKTGAMEAARMGIRVIETTWSGGRSGDVWDYVKMALEKPDSEKTKADWRIRFFAWWTDARNVREGDVSQIDPETIEYLDQKEAELAMKFTPGQRLWYWHTKQEIGVNMQSQNPTTFDECFDTPAERAFFDQAGLKWQETQIATAQDRPKEGDLVMQGKAVSWIRRQSGGWCRIWEHPEDGESYILFADWCVGRQAAGSQRVTDTNAIGVIRAGRIEPATGRRILPRVVAAVQPDDRSPTDVAIERVVALHRYYDCMVAPETNNKDNICHQLMAAGVTKMWTQTTGANGAPRGVGKTEQVFGFLTTGFRQDGALAGTKKEILDNMARMTREQAWICSCPTILRQMQSFVRDEKGRAQGASGCWDDWVMGPAIGLFLLPSATVYREHRGEAMNRSQFVPSRNRHVGQLVPGA